MNPSVSAIAARGLAWPKLTTGTLLKRYKRFCADVKLENGEIVTAHCPNTGSMTGCSEPGRRVYLSVHDNPKRKLKYTWEMIAMPNSLVGVNTLIPNRLVFTSIVQKRIPELRTYHAVEREVKIGEHCRIDLLLTGRDGDHCYIEIFRTLLRQGASNILRSWKILRRPAIGV
jgi:sugar fermentation stimulation protein A